MALNHRALQRALFRMQLDAAFARRVRAADPAALRTTALGAAELDCLRAADPAALSADHDGARRAQFLRNVASEFQLSVALLGAAALERFTATAAFHRAVEREESLPLALGRHLARAARDAVPAVHAIATLERAMARARRGDVLPGATPPPDHVALAAGCALLELPDGTLAWAAELRARIDRGRARGQVPALALRACEHVLIRSHPASEHARLREVEVERLSPALARFLCAARQPLSRSARAELAGALEASASEIEELTSELVAAGILLDERSALARVPA